MYEEMLRLTQQKVMCQLCQSRRRHVCAALHVIHLELQVERVILGD